MTLLIGSNDGGVYRHPGCCGESPFSWSQFLQWVPGIELIPRLVESKVAVLYDKALCGFGTGRQGLVLQNNPSKSWFWRTRP